MQMTFMGQTWSWDAPWDMFAMSDYNTITSLAESPLVEGLLYVGTDDGRIAVSENGGESWRTVEAGSLPGVPKTAFVNDIRADLHDADTVYLALDNHKYGDFAPYLLVSRDRGRSWKRIDKGIPDRHLVWRLVQDHVEPGLLFIGTEFGVYMSRDAGGRWEKLDGGMPTIAIRDIQIQRRENDLVAASFGRGIFILDDYTPLRQLQDDSLEQEALLFGTRDAHWYFQREVLGSTAQAYMGDGLYVADNPPFGAVLTYRLAEGFPTREARRQEAEKARLQDGKSVRFAGWEAVEAERRETPPALQLVIRDDAGSVIRRLDAPVTRGFHRVAWDLRHPFHGPIETPPNWEGLPPTGLLAQPGRYTAELQLLRDGAARRLGDVVSFEVERLYTPALPGAPLQEVHAFWREFAALSGQVSAARYALEDAVEAVETLQQMLLAAPAAPGDLDAALHSLRQELHDLDSALSGNRSKAAVGDYNPHTVGSWLWHVSGGVSSSSYGPTAAHLRSFGYAKAAFQPLRARLNAIIEDELPTLRVRLQEAGAPWGAGQRIAQ
jgi:hypothetical protein